jgi:hypothetical protein
LYRSFKYSKVAELVDVLLSVVTELRSSRVP